MSRRRSVLRRWARRTLIAVGLVGLAALVWEVATWPDVARLRDAEPETTAFIERYQRSRGAQGLEADVAWRWVDYDAVSIHLKHAVLVSEDIGFFSHQGFDLGEVKIALSEALEKRELPRGASTITQQLAKNLWLSPSRDPLRKMKEAVLTWQLERHLPKRRILELYLNVVELGDGIYGVEAASHHYFGRSASTLRPRQAAELAAGLPSPGRWHPGSDSPAYRRRVEITLGRMQRTEWLARRL